ncbi:YbaN family protein [Imhoffiella purpurea]|uniref:DUF454 domain-containing protein n=1 Tax=Imhoffiella purpurea TaxID=1249627 RepID=W9V4E1_9GAMM|nr:YbaN family protein [Imhoffiella purpurea]EXJ14368.1 hypothetical protein D779_2701 [Imhoffiella purpurea]
MQADNQASLSKHDHVSPQRRMVYNLLAWLCFGLGFVGILVPLMPTTVFWICAAWLWLRSKPHRVRFLVEHPHFGESIRRFLEHGEVCRTGKKAAIIGMSASLVLWMVVFRPAWTIALLVGGILALVALWIATRPEGEPRKIQTQAKVTLDPGAWSRNRATAESSPHSQG